MIQPDRAVVERFQRPGAIVLLAAFLGALFLIVEAWTEPYHIDELWQVASYDFSAARVARSAAEQQQPPLDSILNAALQRVVGVGDFRQRLLSVLFGTGTLVLLGFLCLGAGLSRFSALAVFVLAASPLVIEMSAYARPYALPLFLIFGFVVSTEAYLRAGRKWIIGLIFLTVLLLPLSRTTEPPMFLLACMVTLVLRYRFWPPQEQRQRLKIPVAASFVGIALSGLVFVVLRKSLSRFTTASFPNFAGLGRLVTDLPCGLADAFPYWPAALSICLFVLLEPGARHRLFRIWWWWPLFAFPFMFTCGFFLSTETSQPYYHRYLFSFWPSFAVMVAVATARLYQLFRSRWHVPAKTGAVFVGLFSILLGYSAVIGATTTKRGDFRRACRAIAGLTTRETVVLYEHVRPAHKYHAPFLGIPRYLPQERVVVLARDVAVKPQLVPDNAPVAMLLNGAAPIVEGWQGHRIDRLFTLYIPNRPRIGRGQAAKAFNEFAKKLDKSTNAYMRNAASALLRISSRDVSVRAP